MDSTQRPRIRKVAVIGAGPAGVTAAKYLAAEKYYDTIVVFEQQKNFGGVWNYSTIPSHGNGSPNDSFARPAAGSPPDEYGSKSTPLFQTPMYDGLETNIPDFIMEHSDDRSLQGHQLFPPREVVLKYLENHGATIAHHVRFGTQVTDVCLDYSNGQERWQVTSRGMLSQESLSDCYDAVVVASGHYSVPFIPEIKGIRKWMHTYPGNLSHSKSYRKASDFQGKKVLLVGYSASGVDICLHLSEKARLPILVSRRSTAPSAFATPYKVDVPEIEEFLDPREHTKAVRFTDGAIESDVDAVLFCTGYFYSYPFLASLATSIVDTGERVRNLYQHMFHIQHPTLAFIGLPSKIIPFRTFECQAAVAAKVWAQRLVLPGENAMQQWETELIRKRGLGKSFHVLDYPKDFDYHNELVEWCLEAAQPTIGLIPPRWTDEEYWVRKNIPAIKGAFIEKGQQRHDIKRIEDLGFRYREVMSGT